MAMKPSRSLLLVASALVVIFLLGGGFVVRVGAAESSYRQAVLFAEILGQIMDHYVDPVETDRLLVGAYEGMLGGLDSNSAYLTADEVRAWNAPRNDSDVGPGFSVLKSNRTLQVVTIDSASTVAAAGLEVGDHVRSVDGVLTRDLSLDQARRLLAGAPGTAVKVEVLHPSDGFRREEFDFVRSRPAAPAYDLEVLRGTAVLRVERLRGLPLERLADELDDVRRRGVQRMLLDLRNVAEGDPREISGLAGLFAPGATLNLRDRSGRLVETVVASDDLTGWNGELALLVNRATAGGAEALAQIVRDRRSALVYGESTYGLGAEPKLYELEGGAALLVSSQLWETADGKSWNDGGLEPDEAVRGEGETYADVRADQLNRVLALVDRPTSEALPDAA